MTLKEIIAQRRMASAKASAETKSNADNHVAVVEIRPSGITTPLDKFFSFFDGCEDF